ncbi:hypothetical protein TruAng_011559 [Truncatella angustata]|nr:hypothetical protein TruAng_011559 [Truncatella angustata]
MVHVITPDDDSIGPLTFGIELEFLVPMLKPLKHERSPPDPRPIFHAEDFDEGDPADPFNKFIFPALQAVDGIQVRDHFTDVFAYPLTSIPKYDAWRLIDDFSVKPGHGREYSPYEWAGKEVTSEVLKADDAGYPKKITDVCRAIRECRVHLNSSAGVHVHVGHGDDGFSLKTLKRVATIMWLMDSRLLYLHHPSRRDNANCELLSKISKLSHTQEGKPAADPGGRYHRIMDENVPTDIWPALHAKLQQIWFASDIEQIAHLMSDRTPPDSMRAISRGTVGFRRLISTGRNRVNINTVEFRQMAGSLEPDHIIQWVKVCLAIVDFARHSENDSFKSVVRSASMQPEENTYFALDFLNDIGLYLGVPFWAEKLEGYILKRQTAMEFYENGDSNMFVPAMQ